MTEPAQEQPAGSPRLNLRERAARRRTATQSRSGISGFLWRAFCLVALGVGGFSFYQHFLAGPPVESQDPTARPPGAASAGPAGPARSSRFEDEEAAQRTREFETAQGILKQQHALAKLKQQQVLDVGGQVSEAALAWRAELDRWDDETTALLQNDKGKALAANPPAVNRFRALYDVERPGREDVGRLTALAEGIVSAVKSSHDNPADGSIPPEEMRKQLQNLLREARDSRDRQRQARERIEALVVRAQASGAVGTKPLAAAVEEQAEEERLAVAASIAEQTRKAQEEATERVAKAKADQIREVGEKQEAIVRAETEAQKMQKERERLRRLAADPAIQARFAPFLAKGKYLIDSGGLGEWAVPASFGNLSRAGYLDDVKLFAKAMSGESKYSSLFPSDRPRFPKPQTDAEWRRSEQDLARFKELGPTWVEMGKLNP